MTFFGSTANDAAYNAWLTEAGDATNRGKIEGINAMMPLVAILAVFGGFMGFDLEQPDSWSLIYIIIGGVVLCVGIAGLFLIEETKVTFDFLDEGPIATLYSMYRAALWLLFIFLLINLIIRKSDKVFGGGSG